MNQVLIALSSILVMGGGYTIASEQGAEILDIPVSLPLGIDAMVSQTLETFHIPGAAIGLIVDGKVVLTRGYGFRDLNNSLPVTENTLFAIASCTKAFTTYVLGQLVDEGKVSWDDPVIKYLPEFRLKDKYTTDHITIRDLATHQSGLPSHDDLWYHKELSRNELLEQLQYFDPTTNLRGGFQYNNLMYVVAGLIIEKVTGLPWEEAVRSRVFAPMRMNQSNCSILDSQNGDDFSFPYKENNGTLQVIPFYNISIIGPAGSINSSAADMIKWMELQLSNGISEDISYEPIFG